MKKQDFENPKLKAVVDNLPQIEKQLKGQGWVKTNAGQTSAVDYNYQFDLYTRRRKLNDLINPNEGFLKKSADIPAEKALNQPVFETGSNTSMGIPENEMTPTNNDGLSVLSNFSKYHSLDLIRAGLSEGIVIACDSEWFYEIEGDESSKRIMLSWQFATIVGGDLLEFVFLRKREKRDLTLELALGRIFDTIAPDKLVDTRRILKYKAWVGCDTGCKEVIFDTKGEAEKHACKPYPNGKMCIAYNDWSLVRHEKVVLLCHAGKADLSTFDQSGKKQLNILRQCTDVQGGLISLQSIHFHPQSVNPQRTGNHGSYYYPITLNIADSKCHAPASKKSLKDLGAIVGWDKVTLEDGDISHMNQLLLADPVKYMEYASNDSVVTLLYMASLYGYNVIPAVTITSATARVMREQMMDYLDVTTTKDFDEVYRGLTKVKRGTEEVVSPQGSSLYLDLYNMEAVSDKASIVHRDAAMAFHGGYNSCSDVGYFDCLTFDYDLQNAYPTSMCLIPDVDWDNPYDEMIINRELTLHDFTLPTGGFNPITMMIAYVRFEFPEDTKYASIPIDVDGVPIFPLSSDGVNGVYACGPEIYLALKLGAKVYCERGYILNPLLKDDQGTISYSVRSSVKNLVRDRSLAKKDCGKGSLEELILKTMVNSGFGKIAQNVIEKTSWSGKSGQMEEIGCSSITNPVTACMITSIIRAVLIAAQHQCTELGYMACSVTTDGFISDIPENVLCNLDLLGFRKVLEESRLYLTDGMDPSIWEIKHAQDDLVNFTTRGNVSLHRCENFPIIYNDKKYAGVCAHNGAKSGFVSDTKEDREWLMTSVLSRVDAVESVSKRWSSLKDMLSSSDFSVRTVVSNIRMDFDMKRKPVRDSFTTVTPVVNGVEYEIANFTTVPYDSVGEFKLYREKKKLVKVLRTEADWESFWVKIDLKDTNLKVRDLEWTKLNSCVMGHRAGLWNIPGLNLGTVADKCAWINKYNRSGKVFKVSDWKNAARANRQARILPKDMIKDLLEMLINA